MWKMARVFVAVVMFFAFIALGYANGPMVGFKWNMNLRGLGYETGWDQKTSDAIGTKISVSAFGLAGIVCCAGLIKQ